MSIFSRRLLCTAALLAPLVLLTAASAANAQSSVYVTTGLANYGFTHLYSNSSDTSFKGDTGSFGAGVTYNFPIESRVKVGLDGRFAGSPGDKGGFLTGAALRVAFVPHHVPLRPYLQIGGGVVHSSYTQSIYFAGNTAVAQRASVTNGALQLAFGLDIRLTDRYDLRLPEYGAEAGGGNGVKVGTGFLNLGLVYHFRPAKAH